MTEKFKDGLFVIKSAIESRVDLTQKTLFIRCPYGSETRVLIPRTALSGEEDFYDDTYCYARTCSNHGNCPYPYFRIEVKDGKIRSYKGTPDF